MFTSAEVLLQWVVLTGSLNHIKKIKIPKETEPRTINIYLGHNKSYDGGSSSCQCYFRPSKPNFKSE